MHNCWLDKSGIELKVIESMSHLYLQAFLFNKKGQENQLIFQKKKKIQWMKKHNMA